MKGVAQSACEAFDCLPSIRSGPLTLLSVRRFVRQDCLRFCGEYNRWPKCYDGWLGKGLGYRKS